MKTYDELVDENQALAAHVERLTALLLELDYTMPVTPHLPMAKIKGEYLERVEEALDEGPITSLARREAHWKAEGALDIRHLTQGDDWEDQELREVIDDYVASRRQAEDDS